MGHPAGPRPGCVHMHGGAFAGGSPCCKVHDLGTCMHVMLQITVTQIRAAPATNGHAWRARPSGAAHTPAVPPPFIPCLWGRAAVCGDRIGTMVLSTMTSRPAALCSAQCRSATTAAALRALPRLPARLGSCLDSSAALRRPLATQPSRSSSRPLTVAQAAPQQPAGALAVRGTCEHQCASPADPAAARCRPPRPPPTPSPPPRPSLAAVVAAAAAPEEQQGSSMMKTLTLGLLFGLWYLFNIQFNM